MKIALSWLKQYLELAGEEQELSDLLTFSGIEVEAIEHLPAFGKSVVAARVISADPVPKTDHLRLCRVDIGSTEYSEKDENNTIQVICGAPNCESGMIGVLALPGSQLQDMQISKAKIRGIHSHGMLCSERELGLSDNHAGIISLPPDIPIGTLADELFDLPDIIYQLEITPNRSDLLGYQGIARDLSAKLFRSLISCDPPQIPVGERELKLGLYNEDPQACPRYTARVIKGVRIAESPLWLKTALLKSGLRPINNVVDITNYVMLETGHPLHAFDYDTLEAKDESQGFPDIVVRKAYEHEGFTALDGKDYILDSDDLVIADGKKASALAGVMGSVFSAISDKTVNIVLESAAFHPGTIRRTSYKHKLSTDSSYRFERHLSARYATQVSDRATDLILQLAGGTVCGEILDSYPVEDQEIVLGVRPERFELLIGYTLPGDKIREILENLGFTFLQYGDFKPGPITNLIAIYCHHTEEMKKGVTEFTELDNCQHAHYYRIPAYRKDITREADILEELARLAGYDRVPTKTTVQQIMDRHAYRIKQKATDWVVAFGAFETLNYSFADPDQMLDLGYREDAWDYIRLVNPQSSNQSVMRVSLIPQLLNNLSFNLNHAERDIKLFELGRVYHKSAKGHKEPTQLSAIFTGKTGSEHWQHRSMEIDYFWIKGCFEGLLQNLGISFDLKAIELPYLISSESFAGYCEDEFLGNFGRIKPPVLEAWNIDVNVLKQDVWILSFELEALIALTRDKVIQYQEIPKFPSVIRDISFLIPDRYSYAELKRSIMTLNTKIIREVNTFDEYRSKQMPQGFRSLSLHVVLQDKEKTLTDQRVDELMTSIKKMLSEKYEITMR